MRQSDDGSGVVTLAACTLCPSRFDQTLCYLSHRNRTCCHSTGGRRLDRSQADGLRGVLAISRRRAYVVLSSVK